MKNIVTKLQQFSTTLFNSLDVAIDLGTLNTRIGIDKKGIVLREPTFIGQNVKTSEFIFFGDEAKEIFGKAPGFISIIKPIQNGIISDFDSTVFLVKHFLQKSVLPFFLSSRFFKNNIVGYTTSTASSTEVEQKAIEESLLKSGFSKVYLLDKSIVTAYGAKLPVFSNKPVFLIDMGGGIIEISVIVMGGIVAQKTIKQAGENMDKLIINYLHLKYGVIIGEQTAENLKLTLLNLKDESLVHTIRGKSLENGLPKSIRVKVGDVKEALFNNLNLIIDSVKEILEATPPELIDEIIRSGIYLTGGLARIPGIDDFISKDLKIPVVIAENPDDATISGIMKIINDKTNLKRVIIR